MSNYYLVFDTNTLFKAYKKSGNFNEFSFNSTFQNIINYINELDIYEHVTVMLPEVVWKEMFEQEIAKHDEKLKEFLERSNKYQFPEVDISVKDSHTFGYRKYLLTKVQEYKEEVSTKVNRVINLPLPTNNRFDSIVSRAFEKRPPFEGSEKKSDKGFKDALLWEAIIEFAENAQDSKFILYTEDNIFSEILEEEFNGLFEHATIKVCDKEAKVKSTLDEWAKEIDIYSYHPVEEYIEYEDLIDWLKSSDFLIQLIDRDWGLVESSKLVKNSSIDLISYDNIQVVSEKADSTEYALDAVLRVSYTLTNDMSISEDIDVVLLVSCLIDEIYSVEDIYRSDEFDETE